MSFVWAELLWLLAAVPALVAAYLLVLRRKKRAALRFAHLALVKEALGQGAGLRRHVPPILFLAALAVMILAMARPTGVVMLPSQTQTIILAMDVSGSMRAQDVKPNRLAASQIAAKAFVREVPRNTRIGVISFAGTAAVVQPPTVSRDDVIAAIDRFQLQRGTATGSGIIVSLATLFPDAGIDVSTLIYGRDAANRLLRDGSAAGKPPEKPVPPGSFKSAAIILLTDGQRTTGPDPDEAAKMAADRGVRVFTVGFGTPDGEVIGFEGWSFRAQLDEDSLKSIARITHGEYFYAGSATELRKVYDSLNTRLVMERKDIEVTALFAALAAAFALVSAMLSLIWFNRIL